MTKAEQIMRLHRQGKTTRGIATAVYGLPDDAPNSITDKRMAYVRVVLRQRQGHSSLSDKRYLSTKGNRRRRVRYRDDPIYRERRNELTKAWRQANREYCNAQRRARRAQLRAEITA